MVKRCAEDNDLTLFRRGGGGGLADVTNVFFFFLNIFLQKTGDVEVKLVKCWECKGEGLASFGNPNTYYVSPYIWQLNVFFDQKREGRFTPFHK